MEGILLGAYMEQMEKPSEAGAGTAESKRDHEPTLRTKYGRRKRKLRLYTVVNLGPRGSKRKVIKIERNRLSMRCQMDCQEGR